MNQIADLELWITGGVKPTDPLTFVCVAIVLMGVTMVACHLPARRLHAKI